MIKERERQLVEDEITEFPETSIFVENCESKPKKVIHFVYLRRELIFSEKKFTYRGDFLYRILSNRPELFEKAGKSCEN